MYSSQSILAKKGFVNVVYFGFRKLWNFKLQYFFSFLEHYDHYHHLLCQTDHRQTLFLHTLLMANQSIKIWYCIQSKPKYGISIKKYLIYIYDYLVKPSEKWRINLKIIMTGFKKAHILVILSIYFSLSLTNIRLY